MTEDRFDRIRAALATVPAHLNDPPTARKAGQHALEMFSNDERAVLSAVVQYPATGFELDLVFPHWRPGHAAKRASVLKCQLGLLSTNGDRRKFPGHSYPSAVYRPTRMGFALHDAWPNTHPRVLIDRGIAASTLAVNAPADRECWFCPARFATKAGVIQHGQRAHGIPRIVNGWAA